MRLLLETDELTLVNEFETVHLIEKSTGRILLEDWFYGDPDCGLIDPMNRWAIIGGDHLTIWTPQKTKKFEPEQIRWIHALRIKSAECVEILTDPCSEETSIWEIDTGTFMLEKVRDFDPEKESDWPGNDD